MHEQLMQMLTGGAGGAGGAAAQQGQQGQQQMQVQFVGGGGEGGQQIQFHFPTTAGVGGGGGAASLLELMQGRAMQGATPAAAQGSAQGAAAQAPTTTTTAVSAARAAAREREDKERLGTLQLGRRVRVAVKQAGGSRQLGSVRYLGAAQFQGGWWVGVRLDAPLGRNNGSVNGVRYFVCEEGHGLFVRPSSVESVDAPPRSVWEEWEDIAGLGEPSCPLADAADAEAAAAATRRRRRSGGGGQRRRCRATVAR